MSSQNSKIFNFLKDFNPAELATIVALIALVMLPQSIPLRQFWTNVFSLKYIYLSIFFVFMFIFRKDLISTLKQDLAYHAFLAFSFVIFYFYRGYIEMSFIPLGMTMLLLRMISKYELSFNKLQPVLWVTLAFLLIKFPLYTWANARYNLGLGNPNHAALLVSALLMAFLFNKKYIPCILLFAFVFILKSYAAILTCLGAFVLFALYQFKWSRDLLKKLPFVLLPIGCLIFFLTFVSAFYIVASGNIEKFQKALDEASINAEGENITLETPEVFFDTANRVKLNYNSKIFDLSGFTRVHQLNGFKKLYPNYLFIGDENAFVKKVYFTPHNNVLGMVVIFGLVTLLVYIVFLHSLFPMNSFLLLPFIPILGSDTAVSFYGVYFVFIYMMVRLCIDFKNTKEI